MSYKTLLVCILAINVLLADSTTQENLVPSIQQDTTITEPQANPNPNKDSSLYLKYNIGFDFFLDNTEGSDPYWATRTLYALRLAPEIGLGITKNHSLMVGGFGIQNMGATSFPTKANITAYYRYDGKYLKANLGIFPRTYWRGNYPLSFFRHDFLFLNPNSNGILLQYISSPNPHANGYVELVFDWFGGNLSKRFDEFFVLLGSGAKFWRNSLLLGGNFLLYHFKNDEVLGRDGALTSDGAPDTYLMDKIYYNAYIGADFAPFAPFLDEASIKVGALGSIERKRRLSGLGSFHNGSGGQVDVKIQYKGFGIEEGYYFGQPQMRYFNEYGEGFYDGLPFYQAGDFNRLNAYYEYKNKWLKLNVSFVFYTIKSQLAMQQMLTLSIDTHNIFQSKKLMDLRLW